MGRPVYFRRIERFQEKTPATKEEALAVLWGLVASETAWLKARKVEVLAALAAAELAEATRRSILDETPVGALRIRYEADAERSQDKALGELDRRRKPEKFRAAATVAGDDPRRSGNG